MVLQGKYRVIAYVDGFNLYYGMRESKLRRCYWLDVAALCRRLLSGDQQLIRVNYFTSPISGSQPDDPPELADKRNQKRTRQGAYLDALGTVRDLDIIHGKFLAKPRRCFQCDHTFKSFEEKMTDVNIATAMLVNAYSDQFDTALLISGDSDLTPPIRVIRETFPKKRVVVAFPPNRHSFDLEQAATKSFDIWEKILAASQLPESVNLASGGNVTRPAKWR